MSDKTFETSLTAVTALVLLWIILGIVLRIMPWGWVVVFGLVIEIGVGGVLLRYWGKGYMEKG